MTETHSPLTPIIDYLNVGLPETLDKLAFRTDFKDTIRHQLHIYVTALDEWNQKFNLFSKNSYKHLPFHIQDCIILAHLLYQHQKNSKTPPSLYTVIDMGSGSGLPSVILSVMNPNHHVIAVESKTKKHSFLFHVKQLVQLVNFRPILGDINEVLCKEIIFPHAVTAKAFAPYPKLKKICENVQRKNKPQLFVPICETQAGELYHEGPILTVPEFEGHYYFSQEA